MIKRFSTIFASGALLLASWTLHAAEKANLYSCKNDEGVNFSYGTTDATGQPFLAAGKDTFRFGQEQYHVTWERELAPDGSTHITGISAYKSFGPLYKIEFTFPEINISDGNSVEFSTTSTLTLLIPSMTIPPDEPSIVTLRCRASAVQY